MVGHSLSCSLVGLPNVGKSTLFNVLTESRSAQSANFPFCTIEPNVGIVYVPDPRLKQLASVAKSRKIVPATMKIVDVAGLVQGAHEGAGLGNRFLSHVRETDLIIQVVRCFDDPDTIHVLGRVDPVEDAEIIHLECVLADLKMAQDSLQRRKGKGQDPKMSGTISLLRHVIDLLEEGTALRSVEWTSQEKKELGAFPFLTLKPLILAANLQEDAFHASGSSVHPFIDSLQCYAAQRGLSVLPFCACLEEEMLDLDPESRLFFSEQFLEGRSSLDQMIRAAFSRLGLISFFTAGELEARAWPIRSGVLAPEAAGEIHTDIQKGFIRAEQVSYDDFIAYNGRQGARDHGRVRHVGRDYIVLEGDVLLFFHKI
ncbi:redox-regulated ATPase YchF [Candidatus Similichlamydia laticola]|uniref:Ribosome-binding ATPase YchF n=1 Tax=Candidatus Similichlamydia laticola TaxID=2170265 RepID=A0A369KEZ0_9BACT|nr:redox-regulated ATPase YchF [Candidatus Similichlamydia laticola]RDB31457.1 GTP-binding and nucleic acid-binding protein YchF [Candidatus Similichlamydia laticola]